MRVNLHVGCVQVTPHRVVFNMAQLAPFFTWIALRFILTSAGQHCAILYYLPKSQPGCASQGVQSTLCAAL